MVAGLGFLSKKSFNPKNLSNQKAVWEARQRQKEDQQRAKQREKQLRRERDDEELAFAREGKRGSQRASLRFMYDAPSGLEASKIKREDTSGAGSQQAVLKSAGQAGKASGGFTQLQLSKSGETAAASRGVNTTGKGASNGSGGILNSSGAALTGTTIERKMPDMKNQNLSALEKAVGRKDGGSSLTLEEQVARFPQLKNAPMAKGMNGTNVQVTFKPLGTRMRNVRCMVCGAWGHSKGDRECSISGWDPFSSKPPPVAVKPAAVKPAPTAAAGAVASSSTATLKQWSYEKEKNKDRKHRRDRSDRKKRKYRDSDSDSDNDGDDSDKSDGSDSEDSYDRRRRRKKEKKRRKKHKSHKREKEHRRRKSRNRSHSEDDYASDDDGDSYDRRRHHRHRRDDRKDKSKRRR